VTTCLGILLRKVLRWISIGADDLHIIIIGNSVPQAFQSLEAGVADFTSKTLPISIIYQTKQRCDIFLHGQSL
jgi:hypothetical protein